MTTSTDDSTTGIVKTLTTELTALVHQEIQHAQLEMTAKAKQAGKGAAMLGGAGVLGAMAAGTSAALLLRTLDRALPRSAAALVATALYGGGAAALATVGLQELRRTGSVVPTETVDSLKRDVQAATAGPTSDQTGPTA